MDPYVERTGVALATFDQRLDALARRLRAADVAVPANLTATLESTFERLAAASAALRLSFQHIERTALDIVDLQARLEGETASLASALRALGELLERVPAGRAAVLDETVSLEEASSALAAATFPGVVQGLASVNRALWDFQGPVWKTYERTLAEVVGRRTLTSTQVARIEETAGEVRARFEAVNALINALASSGFSDRDEVAALVNDARDNLSLALRHARSKAADAYRPFHAVLKRAESVAERVNRELGRCRIPLFPRRDDLDEARGLVEDDFYRALSGVERFALLNILSGLRDIPVARSAGNLLSAGLVRRVFAVFPDRIYFEASPGLLTTIDDLKRSRTFASAPAALHRFRQGSVKQTQHRKGNIQLSYEQVGSTVHVDADIDLYRGPVSHLFGEVLINHLTGSTTDQFRVRAALDARRVPPIGGFRVFSSSA